MREFIYYSSKAVTTGNFDLTNLMRAGRMDIAINVLINAFFISHNTREDVRVHLIFCGMPDPPKHIEIMIKSNKGVPETGSEVGSIDISKKDVGGLLKKVLYKYKPGKKTEVYKGIFIEKKNLFQVLKDLEQEGKEIFILDKKGESIRDVEISEDKDPVFILGDQDGLPRKELNRLKQSATPVSVSPKMLFASQVITIVNNELDIRGI